MYKYKVFCLLLLLAYHDYGDAFNTSPLCGSSCHRKGSTQIESTAETSGLYEIQENLIVTRGELEEQFMAGNYAPLEPNKMKGVGSSSGFGSSKPSKAKLKEEGKSQAKVLRKEGVVRIDKVLSHDAADKMREYVFSRRNESENLIDSGSAKSIDLFANVLLRSNRCDLKIPLGPDPVMESLYSVICTSSVGSTIQSIFNKKSILYELSCLISDPGSQRQVVHPDNPFRSDMPDEPVLLTCFIALQNIDMSMGPTVWLPGTHDQKSHDMFKSDQVNLDESESGKDKLLKSSSPVLGLLPKGSCAIFDSRLLHCGSANKSTEGISRALFYFSFKNPKVGYPGNPASILSELAQSSISIGDISKDLEKWKKQKK